MPPKCRRCGMYHMRNCDDGIHSWSSTPYPKRRLLRRKIYDILWKYFKLDLSINKRNTDN